MRWNRAMVSVWVNEQTCPMCSFPLTVSGGVSIAKTSPRAAERANLYYARLFPPARPLLLDAVKRGPVRQEAGLPRALRAPGAGVGAHGAQGYRTAACRPGHGLAARPVRAAEHTPQALVQRLADLVHRADPVDHGALGRGQPGRLPVVQPGADVAGRDQLDLVGGGQTQAPPRGDPPAGGPLRFRTPRGMCQAAGIR